MLENARHFLFEYENRFAFLFNVFRYNRMTPAEFVMLDRDIRILIEGCHTIILRYYFI
jgi:hypothetical protein